MAEPGNLGPGWVGFDYAAAFDWPVRIANDAAMQALGSYEGGRMLFLGLGTGVGSALIDHVLVTLELGDLQLEEGSVSEILGRARVPEGRQEGLAQGGVRAVPPLQKAFLADYVMLGGNAKHIGKDHPPGVAWATLYASAAATGSGASRKRPRSAERSHARRPGPPGACSRLFFVEDTARRAVRRRRS